MKTAMTAEQLVAEVSRQAQARRDFIVPSRAFEMSDDAAHLNVAGETFGINSLAHGQIAEEIGFRRDLYDRLRTEHADLAAHNVNYLMGKRPAAEKRLVRTLDGNARAVLTNRYRCIDNLGLIEQLLPVLMQRPDLRFESADVTERRLYLKVVSEQLVGEVKVGEPFQAGLIIQNSEVGAGAWMIAPFTKVLSCKNGATYTSLGQRQAHIHKGYDGDEAEARELFTDETREADDRAFFLKARDIIAGTLTQATLAQLTGKLREAAGEPVEGDVVKIVEVTADKYGLNETERGNVLNNLIKSGELSRWGVAQAFTRAAQDAATYDRASELETIGGEISVTPGAVPHPEAVSVRRRRRKATAAEVAASN